MEHRGRIEDHDRSFDLEFWREQAPQARFEAAWQLVVHPSKVKGLVLVNSARRAVSCAGPSSSSSQ